MATCHASLLRSTPILKVSNLPHSTGNATSSLRLSRPGSPAFPRISTPSVVAPRPGTVRVLASVATQEPATGIQFPPTFIPPGLSSELTLLGTGVREKKFAIISVKVYAVGLYLDTSSAGAALKGQSGKDLFGGIASAVADKALVLTLVRDVSSDQFVNALNEELVPKLVAADADLSVMGRLSALFEGRKIKKDSAVVLAWEQPQHLKVSFIEDVKAGYSTGGGYGDIESLPLLNALFDLYLGEEVIAPTLLSSIESNAAIL